MTDFVTIQNDLIGQLATTLTALSVTLIGENGPPRTSPISPTTEWAHASILDAGKLTEIGGTIAFHRGKLMVELYTVLGTGSARPRTISNAIVTAFQGKKIGAASCDEVEFRPGARDAGGAFWHSGCSVAFRWENTP